MVRIRGQARSADVAEVTLHVLDQTCRRWDTRWFGWIGQRMLRMEPATESRREGLGDAFTLENATLRVDGRQENRLHHEPL